MWHADFPIANPSSKTRLLAALLLSALVLSIAPAAQAQEKLRLKGVNDRLVRVERVLDQSLLELLQQIESLKREIRVLRGELESQSHELGNIRKRNRDLYLDTDQRISELEKQAEEGALGGGPEAPAGTLDSSALGTTAVDEAKPVVVQSNPPVEPANTQTGQIQSAQAQAGAAPITNSTQIQPVAAAAQPKTGAALPAAVKSATAEKAAYAKAYTVLTTGSKQEALASFKAFLAQYPSGDYADNAWYWQGEAHYALREFSEAIKLFETVVNQFADSSKVPDARLKIAYALFEQGLYAESRQQLNAVARDYPGKAAGTLATKRLADMDAKGL